jgi:hypothetical protein
MLALADPNHSSRESAMPQKNIEVATDRKAAQFNEPMKITAEGDFATETRHRRNGQFAKRRAHDRKSAENR